jgi:hypothetical protein
VSGRAAGQVKGIAPGLAVHNDQAPGLHVSHIVGQQQRVDPNLKPAAGVAPGMQTGQTLETETPSVAAALPAYAALLSDVLPVDFSTLESSIKEFFDQIDQLGLTLTEGQIDLLFTSGIVAVGAAVALEFSRRQLQPSGLPALPPGHGRLPYSDYL